MSLYDFQHGSVQWAVGREDVSLRERQRAAVAGGDLAARFLDEEAAGGEVPRGEFVFEIRSELSAGDHAQVERRGTLSADAVNVVGEEFSHRGECGFHHRATVVIEAESNQNFIQSAMLRDAHSLAVVKGSVSASRDKAVAACRIQDHAADGLTGSVVSD